MKWIIGLFMMVVLSAGIYAFKAPAARRDHRSGFAVLELYTSEGCSSCPPADELAAKIDAQYRMNVYVLCFHVDYWDQLGWKDIYSNAEYTFRQRDYAQVFGISSIYTPQAVINGKSQLVGSNEMQLRATLEGELAGTTNTRLGLKAVMKDSSQVTVSYLPAQGDLLKDTHGVVLHVALVQLRGASRVLKGENEGKRLKHVNIVREFKSVDLSASGGSVEFALPEGLRAKDCEVIAFVQDAGMQVLAAEESSIK